MERLRGEAAKFPQPKHRICREGRSLEYKVPSCELREKGLNRKDARSTTETQRHRGERAVCDRVIAASFCDRRTRRTFLETAEKSS
jgi:hypothetical protein